MISPDDLLQACSLWEKFDVYVLSSILITSVTMFLFVVLPYIMLNCFSPVVLRKFDRGVMVIQTKSHSDEEASLFYLFICGYFYICWRFYELSLLLTWEKHPCLLVVILWILGCTLIVRDHVGGLLLNSISLYLY